MTGTPPVDNPALRAIEQTEAATCKKLLQVRIKGDRHLRGMAVRQSAKLHAPR
jgi:hypothetical protein